MTGMILCFVIPGVLAGLLLGEGVRRNEKRKTSASSKMRSGALHAQAAVPQRGKLYVSDLRSEWQAPVHAKKSIRASKEDDAA